MHIERINSHSKHNSNQDIPKEIPPCCDLRITMSALIEQEELRKLPCFFPERHARKLLLSSEESTNPIWLRIAPQSDQFIFELIDPMADDLKRCNHVFARIYGCHERVGYLDSFAAPSFSGKKALTLVYNIMAVAKLTTLFFYDGSTILPCCNTGPLATLHSLKVLSTGKSWFELQGATAKISISAFFAFATSGASTSWDFILQGWQDPRLSYTKKFNHKLLERTTLFLRDSQPCITAYETACQFLHSLSIQALEESLSTLVMTYPKLWSMQSLLTQARLRKYTFISQLTDDLTARQQDEKGTVQNQEFFHEVRDRLISNKDPVFYQYIIDRLTQDPSHHPISCILAWWVVGLFFQTLSDFRVSPIDTFRLIHDLLIANGKQCKKISKRFTFHCEKEVRARIAIVQSSRAIENVKICAHSTKVQLEAYIRSVAGIGTLDSFLALQVAIQYLGQLPLQSLASIYPELREKLETHLHISEKGLPPTTTLKTIIEVTRYRTPLIHNWIFNELVRGAKSHVSTLFVRLFSTHTAEERIPINELYSLFMIAKYICQATQLFALQMP